MSELKLCPFCGKSRIRETNSLFPGLGECQNCGAVAGRWQSRPLEDALTARIAELEGALKNVVANCFQIDNGTIAVDKSTIIRAQEVLK